ncbi:DUF1489 family protein [Candidatus Halocynthiibacter alkanivorans]|jgi:hypothetical protein|uniref:DUF1489 family protein n=1 Tax=Candidatus Halocynthiibacter alkanivorans TaxID=2267619 RepID=UPI000DF4B29B|nr:DUF1489 domain-containing protein [Candidatus Halocynthiibacter alkanivorans]
MTGQVNLIKLCVGVDSVEQLEAWQHQRGGTNTSHTTRMRPKRQDELLNGGSLYWVIKGVIQARQPILALEEVVGEDGKTRCRIVLGTPLTRTLAAPRRPFQGWRYLKPEDSPPDQARVRQADSELPAELAAALADIGLR